MSDTPHLFAPYMLGSLALPNRIVVSPMCQYSSQGGFANDWHLVHLGSRATGGAGLILTEAAAVSPEGRITPQDLGIWRDEHIEKLQQITSFVHGQGSAIGIQLAHAGRKASMAVPWEATRVIPVQEGGWDDVVGPSALAFSEEYATPIAIDKAGIDKVRRDFLAAGQRAIAAGFDTVELHAAHGYLLHSFLSPLSNVRTDEYGGSLRNRARLLLEIADELRGQLPASVPLLVRISATDWADGGWHPDDAVELSEHLRGHGVALMDVSSGGLVPHVRIPSGPSYQVCFAQRIREETGIQVGAVGMIMDPAQADGIIRSGQADLVLLAREMLRDPYWPLHAAERLGQTITWPRQYLRAGPHGATARESR